MLLTTLDEAPRGPAGQSDSHLLVATLVNGKAVFTADNPLRMIA
jgi:hypothetical protein